MTSWFITKRNEPMHFWGPPGTKKMLQGMRLFMHHDVKARINPVVKASGVEFEVMEVTEGRVVQRTRSAGFTGQILIASDRMRVDVGEKITIHKPSKVPEDLEINSLNFKSVLGTSE